MQKLNINQSHETAFSLVEIMVVMGLIAVLATLGIIGANLAQKSARDEDRKVVVAEIQSTVNDFLRLRSSYPDAPPSTEFQWMETQVRIGTKVVDLDGYKKYDSEETNASQTRYEYLRDLSGFRVCVLLEGGGWYSLGNALADCPEL